MRRLAFLLALLIASPASADWFGNGAGGSGGGGGGPALPSTGIVVRPDSISPTAATGSGYAAGDRVTLNAGCSTNPVLAIGSVSGGVPTNANISGTSVGAGCGSIPSNPVAVLSTTGSGTGATFTLGWTADSIVNHFDADNTLPGGVTVLGKSAGLNMGNTTLGPTGFGFGVAGGGQQMELGIGGAGMNGAENSFFGGFAGTQVTSGNFLLCAGWNACGHESDGAGSTYLNTDAGKYAIHNINTSAIGSNDFKFVWNAANLTAVGENIAQGQFAQQTSSQVTGVGAGTAGRVRVTMASTTGMTSGDYVFAAQFTGCPECNGQFYINVIDATHIDLVGSTFATGTGTGWITDLPTGVINVPVVGTISGTAGVVRLKVRDTFNMVTGTAQVHVQNVGGTTEANGDYASATVVDADCGTANGTGCGVELPGTTFVNAWTSGGTLTIVKGPSTSFLAGYHVMSSTSLAAEWSNIVAIAPGGLTSFKGGTKSTYIGAGIAATTCGSNYGNFNIIMVGFDTSTDCAADKTFQAIALGGDIKLTTQSNIIGQGAGHAFTNLNAGQSNMLGRNVFRAATTLHNSIGIGDQVGLTTCGTNNDVILIGNSNTIDCPTSSIQHWLNIGGIRASIQAPTVSSGFGTSAAIAAGGTTSAFSINVGTGGTANTGVVGVQASPTGWACAAVDKTNPGTANTVALSTSTSAITLNNYSRTTGLAAAWAASDIIEVSCWGY